MFTNKVVFMSVYNIIGVYSILLDPCASLSFFDFLLSSSAVTIKKTAKASSSESSESCEILVCLVCINWTKFLMRVSRTSFLDGELGSSVMGFRVIIPTRLSVQK